jgi:hypothetical protein
MSELVENLSRQVRHFEYLLRMDARVEEGTNALAHATAARTMVALNMFHEIAVT